MTLGTDGFLHNLIFKPVFRYYSGIPVFRYSGGPTTEAQTEANTETNRQRNRDREAETPKHTSLQNHPETTPPFHITITKRSLNHPQRRQKRQTKSRAGKQPPRRPKGALDLVTVKPH